jgi:hypothetical protein
MTALGALSVSNVGVSIGTTRTLSAVRFEQS